MKALVMGGTGFFGKRLVQNLINSGHEVTILSRGNKPLDFQGSFKAHQCDRNDYKSLSKILEGESFDTVYDQICFDYESAKMICELFKDMAPHYIFTSSQSVYKPGQWLKEQDFNPREHEFSKLETSNNDYAEAKRQAESAFTRYGNFPITLVRFPIVIGEDDYTGRFKFHVNRIQEEKEIFFPNLNARISFIYSGDAASALQKIGENRIEGPINCCSSEPISLADFIKTIEEFIGKERISTGRPTEENHSPYGIDSDWFMDNTKAKEMGINFLKLQDILKLSLNHLK